MLKIRNLGPPVRVRAGSLLANPANWREHPGPQREALAGILDEVGFCGSVLGVQTAGGTMLLDGHLRAELRPDDEIDVQLLDLDENEQAKLLASYDPIGAMASANAAKLKELMTRAAPQSEALKAMMADCQKRADEAFAKLQSAQPVVEDEAPAPPKVPVSRTGDVWLLGEHRLACGDSTDAETVRKLMRYERAGLMNIDAPYGVAYTNDERPNPGVAKPRVAKPRVANDTLEGERLQAFLESAFRVAVAGALKPDAAWYLWHPMLTQGTFFAAAAAAAAVIIHRQIIWVKPVLLLGHGHYHWKHELCFMGWVEGHQPPDYGLGAGERTQTTVWEIASVTQAERKEFDHSTPKPVGLFTIPIIKHLKPGEICFDGFAGSCPQLIAAEQTKRRFFGMDLDGRFVDVGVMRWQKLTGLSATLEGNGRTFDEISAKGRKKRRK